MLIFLSINTLFANDIKFHKDDIDTIVIFQTDFDVLTTANVSRLEFETYFKNSESKICRIMANKDIISKYCELLNSLCEVLQTDFLKVLPYDNMKKIVILKDGRVFFVNIDPLDVRAQIIIIYKDGKQKNIWLSGSFVDIDNARFYMSTKLLENIQQQYLK